MTQRETRGACGEVVRKLSSAKFGCIMRVRERSVEFGGGGGGSVEREGDDVSSALQPGRGAVIYEPEDRCHVELSDINQLLSIQI